ncbi:T-cell differentiation antigen CD6 [Camelus dromedarius]|uniref:T-cell differentiation antigen CD6 n=1 Tax=Camelus dromedarius TaxID=9838 RepID=A0A5N4DLY9_CAMDR|nr:T-cell differentiation antigen CD6 [Camelus dromedarius]
MATEGSRKCPQPCKPPLCPPRLSSLTHHGCCWLIAGHPSPSPSDQRDTSSTESPPLEPGERLGVRLVNGSSRCSGTVEVRLRSSWEPACGALWSRTAAEALCSLLDCGGAQGPEPPFLPTPELPPGPAAGNASGAPNATRAVAPAILCSGAKWQLCTVAEHPCSSDGRPAQVTCTGTSGQTRARRRALPV